jgi:dTMP kinase
VRYATGGLAPDLTLLLDVDVETGLSRRQKSGGEWNRLDAYQIEFHRRVREGYLELARQEPKRWVLVDASQPWMKVQEVLRKVISKQIK